MRVVFGIDPGVTGAMAALVDGDPVGVWDLPLRAGPAGREIDPRALRGLIADVRAWHPGADAVACVEAAWGRPGEGVRNPFSLGVEFGRLLATLELAGLRAELVPPATWKREAGLLKQDKSASRALARQRFPAMADRLARVKDHGRAEALLIADHGNRSALQ